MTLYVKLLFELLVTDIYTGCPKIQYKINFVHLNEKKLNPNFDYR